MTTIQLTQKGKDIYGDYEMIQHHVLSEYGGIRNIIYALKHTKLESIKIASNPTELKALIDLGLVEISTK